MADRTPTTRPGVRKHDDDVWEGYLLPGLHYRKTTPVPLMPFAELDAWGIFASRDCGRVVQVISGPCLGLHLAVYRTLSKKYSFG